MHTKRSKLDNRDISTEPVITEESMKTGILTPVLKKGKDNNIPGNYRGIVVTNTFSKILESIIKDRLEEQLKKTQNPLQRGFTEKAPSKFTAFITAETIALYRKLNMELEVLTLDAEKAFDTVNHDIMFNKFLSGWCGRRYVDSTEQHV